MIDKQLVREIICFGVNKDSSFLMCSSLYMNLQISSPKADFSSVDYLYSVATILSWRESVCCLCKGGAILDMLSL